MSVYHEHMQRDLDKLRRRPFFFPLVLPLVLLVILAMAAAWLFDAQATTVVFIIRHAEADSSADPDPPLSRQGRERASRLADLLAHGQQAQRIDAIFASEYRRARQSATPLSEALGLPVNLVPSPIWDELARRIKQEHRGESVLVVGNANTVPQLIEALSGEEVSLNEADYDTMFIIFMPRISKTRLVRARY